MLIGQDRSGKTSLKKSLRGQLFDPNEDSTVGIEMDPSHFKVSTEIWKAGEKDQGRNCETAFSYEHRAARLTVENLSQEKQTFGEFESVPDSIPTDDIRSVEADLASNSSVLSVHELAEYASDFSDNSEYMPMPKSQTNKEPDSASSMQGMPHDVVILIENLLQNVDEVKNEESVYSVLWDFGGQAVYYTTHPLFLTSRAIFLLVNDLSRNPHELAKSVMKQGMFSKFEDSFRLKTNLDYLDFWMSSVASLPSQDDSNPEDSESEVLPEKLPPVL